MSITSTDSVTSRTREPGASRARTSASCTSSKKSGVLELAGRDVDGHDQVRSALLLPEAALSGRLLEDPPADRHDLAALLEEGDELDRGDITELGVLPPKKSLHADHRAPQGEHRLVVEGQLALLVGHPQLEGQLALAAAVLTDDRAVVLVAGRAPALCLVHGGVGPGEVDLGVGACLDLGDADADRGVQLSVPDRHRGLHGPVDALGQRTGCRLGIVEVLGQHDELVATQTAHRVRRPDQLPEAGGGLHQQAVTGGMPEPVIDGLEIVDVEVEEHGTTPSPLQRKGRLPEPIGEQGAVGQSGQLVVQCLMGERGLLLAQAALQGPAGLIELADDADETAVTAEADHRVGHGEQLLADPEPLGFLGQDERWWCRANRSRPWPRWPAPRPRRWPACPARPAGLGPRPMPAGWWPAIGR